MGWYVPGPSGLLLWAACLAQKWAPSPAQSQPALAPGEVPPGLRPWLGRDLCGTPFWVNFHGGLSESGRLFNAMDFPAALSAIIGLLGPVVTDPHVAFGCGTAVAAALNHGAQCCEQMRLPVLGARMRQLAAIFASFDYQMKGEEYIDQSPWPIRWMDSMEGILRSVSFLKQHELVAEPWRGSNLRQALASRHGQAPQLRVAIVSVCDYDAGQTPLARLSEINKGAYADRHGYDIIIYDKAPFFADPLSSLLTEPVSHRPAAWSKVDAILTSLSAGKHDWVMWMDCDSFFMDPDTRLEDIVAMTETRQPREGSGSDLDELRKLVRKWLIGPHLHQQDAASADSLMQWYDELFDKHWRSAGSQDPGFEGRDLNALAPMNKTLGWDHWLLDEERTHLIGSEDGLMLNTGNMLVRASVWSWQFFQKVRGMTFGHSPVTQHPWWEQTAMVYLLQLPFTLAAVAGHLQGRDPPALDRGFAPACFLLSQKQINTYPPLVASSLLTHQAFDVGDFIVSFSGCKVYSSQEVCNQLFLSYFFQVHDARALESDPGLVGWL